MNRITELINPLQAKHTQKYKERTKYQRFCRTAAWGGGLRQSLFKSEKRVKIADAWGGGGWGGVEWLKACCSDPKAGIQAGGRDSGVEACNRVKEFSHVWGSKAKLWSTLKARSRILKINVSTNQRTGVAQRVVAVLQAPAFWAEVYERILSGRGVSDNNQ